MANEEINLKDFYFLVRKKIRLILTLVFVATVASAIYSFCLPKIYRSTTSILSLGNNGNMNGNMALQLQGMPLIAGLGGGGSSSKILVILGSRTFFENLIVHYDLLKIFFKNDFDFTKQKWKKGKPPSMEVAIDVVRGMIEIAETKKAGIINITSTDKNPEFTKQIIDDIIMELRSFIAEKALSNAKKYRIFLEQQLMLRKKEFLDAGKDLSQFYQQNKISPFSGSLDVSINVDENNPADESTGSSNDAMKSNLTENIADLTQKKNTLDQLLKNGGMIHDIPQQVYLDYVNQKRVILSNLVNMLSQQYEMAKMDEARDDVSFEVIDTPRVPETRFKPQRRKIVTTAFFISLLMSLSYVFIRDYFDKMQNGKKS